jgi:predicted DCC family thiol-disulfide oxidoreductase YuxK
VLFALLLIGFAGLAIWSALERQWVVLAASVAIALWFSESAYRSLR